MARVSKLSLDQRSALLREYSSSDLPVKTIAARYGVSEAYVSNNAKKFGIERQTGRQRQRRIWFRCRAPSPIPART